VSPPDRFDVVVLGAGPAGCAAATLLARRSHRVALVRPGSAPAERLGQSVPPSARRILDELGFLEAVERACFFANRGNSVWWAAQELRREVFADDQTGFHTDRAGLEAVLATACASAGVTVLEGTTARSAEETPDGWEIHCEAASALGSDRGAFVLRAPWVIDATGRRGLIARTEGRKPDRDTTTLALIARWRRPGGWPADDAHDTLIESYEDGWAWSVPLDPEVRCFTAMVDQRHTDLSGADAGRMLEAELEKTSHVGATRTGAEPEGQAWACPASLYTSTRFGRSGLLLAGDAGSFIDPLSSFGVKKALSSGWLAGVVAHTALVAPTMADTAVEFFDRREAEVYRRYRAASVEFFGSAADAHGTPYWIERAEAARRFLGSGPNQASDPDQLESEVPEAEVRHAFDELRSRPALMAVRGSTVRILERPAIRGERIALQPHVASSTLPEGVRYVRGVDLLHLLDVAPQYDQVPDGWAAYNGVAAPVTLPDYLTALATAFAAGLLEHSD
jgi:flavin-dependent dehydrogenase